MCITLLKKVKKKIKNKIRAMQKKNPSSAEPTKILPDTPYGPKIASITDKGIEFYWKKVEHADGYEIFRSYSEEKDFEKIKEIQKRNIGTYIDNEFDRDKKMVYYKSRSYLDDAEGNRKFSDFTDAAAAIYREELILEREQFILYDGTERAVLAFYGWGEVADAVWTSEDEKIATVSADGVIHALASGTVKISCSSESLGMNASATVIVNREDLPPLDIGKKRFKMNPESNIWENPDAKKTNEAVIMMAGDLMCGTKQTKTQYNEEHGWSYHDSYEYVKEVTAKADFAVGNLETLMAPGWPYMIDEAYINNQNNCNNPPRYLDAVLYGGFDGVTMSNNHNCDGGVRALQETIDEVRKREIPNTGVFKNSEEERFFIADVNGIKVGFLAYMTKKTGFNGKDKTWTKEDKDTMLNVFSKERATEDIARCREAGAEYIIVYMHWGQKNYVNITQAQEEDAIAVAEAGADYIVGANPHMLQVYEEIVTENKKVVPCFYSTGNFQAFMNQIPGNRDSVMVRIRLKKDWRGKVKLKENHYIPFHTYKDVNGCFLAPVAVSENYNAEVNVKRQKKYRNRIAEVVGEKVSAL